MHFAVELGIIIFFFTDFHYAFEIVLLNQNSMGKLQIRSTMVAQECQTSNGTPRNSLPNRIQQRNQPLSWAVIRFKLPAWYIFDNEHSNKLLLEYFLINCFFL